MPGPAPRRKRISTYPARTAHRAPRSLLELDERDGPERSRRVAEHHGDVTEAMQAWLVETGRAVEDADIAYLEVRGWVPDQ
ncbi:hypothetical protein [Kitasatospora sp. P5_F3]